METVLTVVVVLLLASGALVTVRLVRGPSMLDRAVGLDALVAVVMAGIGVLTAVRRIPYYTPALLVLSFLGFTGSVSIARFLVLRDEAGSEDADEGDGDDEDDEGDDAEAEGTDGTGGDGRTGGTGGPGGGEQGSGG